jgi:polyhydroxybutyrate depolymerase
MPRRERWRVSALAVGIAIAVPAAPLRAERWTPGDHELAIEHGGRTRTALVHVPPAAVRGEPLPVVLSFHGGGGNAAQHRGWIGLDRVADRAGFVAVYPSGSGRLSDRVLLTWNAGACCGYAARERIDDVGATLAWLEALARRTPVDATRVYASGMSNGAMFAFRLAHDAGERFAGIATVAGAARFEPFAPQRAMPIVHFHSADDPRARYDGGLGPRLPFGTRVLHPPVAAVLDDWVVVNGCPKHPLRGETRAADAGSADTGQTATQHRYAPCASGAPIELWKLTGAGHVWPGAAPLRVGQWLLGRPSALVDASSILWDTLARHRRPDAPPLPSADD